MPSVNERITENIVREHFKKDPLAPSIVIEEQKSNNPKIQKLLQNASKSGNGVGKPEFLIHGFNSPFKDLLIVVECKGDTKHHESQAGNQYAQYAVDGVKLYASFLSKEYDVLAIAVSGQNPTNIRVSHSYWRNSKEESIDLTEDKLSTLENYHNVIKPKIEKQLVLEDLRTFAKKLNDSLHDHTIPEDKRAFLVSGILLALEDGPFVSSYKQFAQDVSGLTDNLVETIARVLKKESIAELKHDTLSSEYQFIKTSQSFVRVDSTIKNGEPQYLESLITGIHNNVFQYLKNSKNKQSIDAIGEMYTEFLRYANNEAKLGIVLTPPHVTEFMCELIDVTENDTVIDICCGTAGFLIAAMSRMLLQCKGDSNKIKEIKEKQIIGAEIQSNIHALGCANMILHGDGKSHVIPEDCFKLNNNYSTISNKNITKALLNPPYKAKESPARQLEFIQKSCELLEVNGRCGAIVQMSCATSADKEVVELRRKLLAEHTLEAVISMPDDLFYPVGVVTCIMIFKAKTPHPSDYNTWFGYLKNDGFEKRKNQGRVDYKGRWSGIREDFLKLYKNRKEKSGVSVQYHVSHNDEWCAEAYMETDYSQLTQEHFEETLRKYASFLVMQGNRNEID